MPSDATHPGVVVASYGRLRAHLDWRRLQVRRRVRSRLFELAGRTRPVVRVHDHHGNTYFVATDDQHIGRSLYINGEFEAVKIANILAILAAHHVKITQVLDIGANIGTTTIEMLTRLPHATAVCFEPDTRSHSLLVRNLRGNGLGARARTHMLALSDLDGELTFELARGNPGDHRVRTSGAPGAFGEATRKTVQIPARRLDSLIDTAEVVVSPHTLACIDVQGHEWQVLTGASRLVGPMTLEFWPYALDRAGTLAPLTELLTSSRVFDVTESPVEIDPAALDALAEDRGPHAIRELLVLPTSGGVSSRLGGEQ